MVKNLKLLLINVLNWCLALAKIDFAVGGQAVIEGVMMRSPKSISIAVRKNNGKIKIKKRHYQTLTQKHQWLNIPILRGVINLFEMMIIGTQAINFSANESIEDEEEIIEKKHTFWSKLLEVSAFTFSFIVAIIFSILLFKYLPLWLTTLIETRFLLIQENYILFNIIDGVLKTSIFIAYIYLLSLIPSFYRLFEYHGAEHKSIFNYENNLPFSPENAQKQSRFHPRCGTSFILIVFVISILVYTFVPKQEIFWQNLALRLAFLPLIAGISYEYLKYTAKNANRTLFKALVAPGLWFQRLTTKEPKLDQLEVGLESLKTALAMEETAHHQLPQEKV